MKNVKKAEAPSISRLQLAPNSPLASKLLWVLACGEQITRRGELDGSGLIVPFCDLFRMGLWEETFG